MNAQTSFGLLQTDQVNCYGQDGRLVDCALSGQDGAFAKTNPVAPDQRFEVMDRVVRDALTGAVWSRDANPAEFPLTGSEARAFVAQMRQDRRWGRDDWQLPPRGLLFSLLSHQRINPALADGHPFENVFTGYYWAAETCRRLPDQAWYVHLGGGRVHRGMKQGSYMLWPVCPGDVGAAIADVRDRFRRDGECVLDRLTGLTWSRDAAPDAEPMDWQTALVRVARLNARAMGGHGDWRMPAIRELESLVDLDNDSPALASGHPFIHVREAYWSSTTSVYEPRYAWTLYTQDGIVGVGFKPGADFHLWPVRG